ncbi:MAG TPA: hypothetical protein VFQ22_00420 [Longimicrobiales bacterium]|nr:hypothetical protein [Longimicrobiales bacterium]
MTGGRLVLALVLGGSALVVLVLGLDRLAERRRFMGEIERLREELYRARVGADRCRSSLTTSEAALHDLTATIDSMRSRVDSFETLGDGKVPAERYEEYLELFDSYNDSVASWEIRSQRLREAEASCRAVIERHNAIRDTIEGVLRDAGIEGPSDPS